MTLIYSNRPPSPVRAESDTDEPSERGIPAHYTLTHDTPAPDAPAPDAPAPGSSLATLALTSNQQRAQRRSLKALAAAVDADGRALARICGLGRGIEQFREISARLDGRAVQLASLRGAGLSDRAAAAPSTARTIKNSLLRAGAGTTRLAAVATGTAVAAVEAAAAVPVAALAGAGYGAWHGAKSGWTDETPVCLKPGAALFFGATAGATAGAIAAMLAPLTIQRPGSFTRQSYAWVDRYPRTQAHIARKQMSNLQLADNINGLIGDVRGAVSSRQNMANLHASMCPVAALILPV
jgi:hypothetical protein